MLFGAVIELLIIKYLQMKKNNLVTKLLLFTFFIIFTGIFNESKAQVVVFPKKEKKSNTVIFPGGRRTTPVVITNGNNLPPGQAKKVYGEKSAKRFAPGQRKKEQNTIWLYNENKKHGNKNKKPNKGHKK